MPADHPRQQPMSVGSTSSRNGSSGNSSTSSTSNGLPPPPSVSSITNNRSYHSSAYPYSSSHTYNNYHHRETPPPPPSNGYYAKGYPVHVSENRSNSDGSSSSVVKKKRILDMKDSPLFTWQILIKMWKDKQHRKWMWKGEGSFQRERFHRFRFGRTKPKNQF